MASIVQKPKKTARKPTPKETAARKEAAKARGVLLRKYDWDGARERFISDDKGISLKALAAELSIPYDQVRAKAAAERWSVLRVEEMKRIFKEKRQKHFKELADDSMAFDKTTINAAKLGMSLVAGRLAEISAVFQASKPAQAAVVERLKAGIPVTREELYSVINYKELRELSAAGQAFQAMGRAAYGTDVQQFEVEGIPEGANVENVISIGAQLGKDDPARLASLLEALERANLISLNLDADEDSDMYEEEDQDTDVVDAEIVEENELPAIGS